MAISMENCMNFSRETCFVGASALAAVTISEVRLDAERKREGERDGYGRGASTDRPTTTAHDFERRSLLFDFAYPILPLMSIQNMTIAGEGKARFLSFGGG